MKKINLEEILNKFCIVEGYIYPVRDLKDSMKEACRQVLELAAENADVIVYSQGALGQCNVDKQSILNTINQVE